MRENKISSLEDDFDNKRIGFEVNNKVTFGCGLYFGGNRRAPHNIKMYEY